MIHTSHKQEEPNMKFSEMPYERIDFDAAKEELSSIIKVFRKPVRLRNRWRSTDATIS